MLWDQTLIAAQVTLQVGVTTQCLIVHIIAGETVPPKMESNSNISARQSF